MQPTKHIAKGFLPTLFCLFSIILVACGSSTGPAAGSTAPSKAAGSKQIYVYADPQEGVADIKTFDPGLSTDLPSIAAIDMVFTGLVQLDAQLNIHPQLAESYSVAADGVTWTFKLRPNLKFSDGTPLTSTDVAYSIDRALQPALKSAVAPIYLALVKDSDKLNAGKIKTIIGDSLLTPDPQTIVIVANAKASYFLDALTYSCSYVVEKSMIDKYGNNFGDYLSQGIGGAGPWMVSKYIHNQEIDFVPNPNYYGPKPQLTKLIFPFYKDSDTAYKAYQQNQISDALVPAANLATAKNLPEGQFHATPQLYINYYTMNYLVKPFDNIHIRQAFALAVNKDTIAHDIHKDSVVPTNHIVPQGMPGFNTNLTGPDGTKATAGNPTMAKQLFAQGLQEEGMTLSTLPPITLTVASAGRAENRNEYAALQQMWQTTLGVSVKINDIDFNKLLDDITAATNNPKGLQFWSIAWIADYPDAQDWTTLQFDKGVPNNNMNYGQNQSADTTDQQATQTLLEGADVNQDPAARLQQYYKAEQQLVNDVAWLPMNQVLYTIVRKPCVVGATDDAQGLVPPDDWAKVYISTDQICTNTSQYQ
ncbi:MAG TPA: peptide ABC transporter substrate-binding protein [Ktedonosporobacter sp.]|nr:peptide ABC transporter substrate-binding protein [Ktedonosporobacter sp.]